MNRCQADSLFINTARVLLSTIPRRLPSICLFAMLSARTPHDGTALADPSLQARCEIELEDKARGGVPGRQDKVQEGSRPEARGGDTA